jgi:LysR family transcriptional regulator, glycine cleavage system transcriptional activator
MSKRLPSLNALKAFEAAARLTSFTLAASELNVTHAAISRHIRDLEATLGAKLFHRTGRGVELTDQGRLLGMDVTPAFDLLVRAAERFAKPLQSVQLVISSDVSFAALWLLPRLQRFTSQHPRVHMVLDPESRLVDFSKYEAHVGIRFGKGNWRDVEAMKIAGSRASPVCSPSLLKKLPIRSPADLAQAPLLAEDSHELWSAWLACAGVAKIGRLSGPVLKGHLAIAAAEAGQGFALADSILAVDGLVAGKLVRPFDAVLPLEESYYLVRGAKTNESRIQAAFRLWLQQEIASSLVQFDAHVSAPVRVRQAGTTGGRARART